MHLVACQAPHAPLEDAPMSALLAAEPDPGDQWESFWAADAYYVRCTRGGGAVEWFMVADDTPASPAIAAAPEGRNGKSRRRLTGTRVLEFPRRQLQTRVVVAKGPDGRGMLVGTARRADRRKTTPPAAE